MPSNDSEDPRDPIPLGELSRDTLSAAGGRTLVIGQTWSGEPLGDDEIVRLVLTPRMDHLAVDVDAPFHDDAPPRAARGSTPQLWEHEVVELFVLGDDERYLEIELGPHGHYLALQLEGVRRVRRHGMPLIYHAHRQGPRWRGRAEVPLGWLPRGALRLNAFALWGTGEARRYLAWRAPKGPRPDFHRLESFAAWSELDGPPLAPSEEPT